VNYLTVPQAAAVAGVTRNTIYNWLKAGKLQFKRTAGGSVRIVESSLWQDEPPQPSDIARSLANY
jgi:excisionase family DNA binding protein